MTPLQRLELRLLELHGGLSFRPALETAAKIGDALLEARALVEHGAWIPWVRRVGLTQRTAHDYMAVARHFGNQRSAAGITTIRAFLKFVRDAHREDRRVAPTAADEWQEFSEDDVDTDMSCPFGNNAEPARQNWRTPRPLFDQLHDIFRFDVDAAADVSNALLPRYWTAEDDAISQDWGGLRCFCNPPYQSIKPFIEKAASASLAVFLVPTNAMNTSYFGTSPPGLICVPSYRVLFVPPADLDTRVNRPSLGTSVLVNGTVNAGQVKRLWEIGPVFRS